MMERFAGSFFKRIGQAYFHADGENTRKLEETFKEEFEKYQNTGLKTVDPETLRDEYGITLDQ